MIQMCLTRMIFLFMKIGEEYNCKILFFGKLDESGEVFETDWNEYNWK